MDNLYYEYKFIIPPFKIGPLLRFLNAAYPQSDPYPKNKVRTIYFDSIDRLSYNECLNGNSFKRKYRIRSYDVDERWWSIQIKEKHHQCIQKYSIRHHGDIKDFSQWPLDDHIKPTESNSILEAMMNKSKSRVMLRPVIETWYTRHRYRAQGVRLTVDEGLVFNKMGTKNGYAHSRASLDLGVLELKSSLDRPHFASIDAFGLRQSTFSKFLNGLQCIQGQMDISIPNHRGN